MSTTIAALHRIERHQRAVDSSAADGGDRLRAARGVVFGIAVAACFWAVAAGIAAYFLGWLP